MLVERKTSPPAARSEAQWGQKPHDLNTALTRTSWLPTRELRIRDWVEHGRRLGVIGRGVGWWVGDWLRYGNMKFGERYARASRITGYDVQTLMNMVYVASAYDVSERRANLSFSHHAELAALPPAARERWLDLAESNRLSVRCLREELRRERRLLAGESAEDGAQTAEGEPVDVADRDEPVAVEAAPAAQLDREAAPVVDGHELRCPKCGCRLAEPPAAPVPLPSRTGTRVPRLGAA